MTAMMSKRFCELALLSACVSVTFATPINSTDCLNSDLPTLENGRITETSVNSSYEDGSLIFYQCEVGYQLMQIDDHSVQTETETRCSEGTWSNLTSYCSDINECETIAKTCHFCTNKNGSYKCMCKPRYKLDVIGKDNCVESCGPPQTLPDSSEPAKLVSGATQWANFYPVNTKLRYTCPSTHTLAGSSAIICHYPGGNTSFWSWNATVPICTKASSSSVSTTTVVAATVSSVLFVLAITLLGLVFYVMRTKEHMHREMDRKISLVSLRIEEAKERKRRQSETESLQAEAVVTPNKHIEQHDSQVSPGQGTRKQSDLQRLDVTMAMDAQPVEGIIEENQVASEFDNVFPPKQSADKLMLQTEESPSSEPRLQLETSAQAEGLTPPTESSQQAENSTLSATEASSQLEDASPSEPLPQTEDTTPLEQPPQNEDAVQFEPPPQAEDTPPSSEPSALVEDFARSEPSPQVESSEASPQTDASPSPGLPLLTEATFPPELAPLTNGSSSVEPRVPTETNPPPEPVPQLEESLPTEQATQMEESFVVPTPPTEANPSPEPTTQEDVSPPSLQTADHTSTQYRNGT